MKHSMFLMKHKGITYPEDINKSSVGLSSIYYWITGLTFMNGTRWTQKMWFSFSVTFSLSFNRNIINFKKLFSVWVKGWDVWVVFLWRGNHSSQEKPLQLWSWGSYKPVLREHRASERSPLHWDFSKVRDRLHCL